MLLLGVKVTLLEREGIDMLRCGHIERRVGLLLLPVALALFISPVVAQSQLVTEYACSQSYETVAPVDELDYRSSDYLGWIVVSIPDDCYRRGYVHLVDVRLSCSRTVQVRLTNPDPPDDPLLVLCVGGLPRRLYGDPLLFHDYVAGLDKYYEVVSSVPVSLQYRVEMDVYRVLTAYPGATPTPNPSPSPVAVATPTPAGQVVCQQEMLDGFVDFDDPRYLGRLLVAYEGITLIRTNEYVRRVLGESVSFIGGVDYDAASGERARLDVCNQADVQSEIASVAQDSYLLLVFFGVVGVSLLAVLVLRR